MKINQIKRVSSDFQQPVNEQELRLCLKHELTNESILDVKELKAGLFNNTYQITTSQNSYILKIAPQASDNIFYNEQALMHREHCIAEKLKNSSPLIPSYMSFFKIGDRDAFLQAFVQGRLWNDVISTLSDMENAALWQQLGTFSKNLHQVSGGNFGYPEPFKSHTRWSDFINDNVKGMVKDCRRLNVFCDEIETYLSYLPHFQAVLDEVKKPKLLHGDLWPRNVIIDGEGSSIHIKAVIDCERAFWGDPISDWVLILYGVPDDFWKGYGEKLVETTNRERISIYKGMYFILNILETTRFQESDKAARSWLAGVNEELRQYLSLRE